MKITNGNYFILLWRGISFPSRLSVVAFIFVVFIFSRAHSLLRFCFNLLTFGQTLIPKMVTRKKKKLI